MRLYFSAPSPFIGRPSDWALRLAIRAASLSRVSHVDVGHEGRVYHLSRNGLEVVGEADFVRYYPHLHGWMIFEPVASLQTPLEALYPASITPTSNCATTAREALRLICGLVVNARTPAGLRRRLVAAGHEYTRIEGPPCAYPNTTDAICKSPPTCSATS